MIMIIGSEEIELGEEAAIVVDKLLSSAKDPRSLYTTLISMALTQIAHNGAMEPDSDGTYLLDTTTLDEHNASIAEFVIWMHNTYGPLYNDEQLITQLQ